MASSSKFPLTLPTGPSHGLRGQANTEPVVHFYAAVDTLVSLTALHQPELTVDIGDGAAQCLRAVDHKYH